jgi:hypothetical protein
MSFQITPTLEIPVQVRQRLLDGTAERLGGVVRDRHSKQIIALLRETCAAPANTSALLDGMGSGMGQLFGYASQVAPMLNLGATVAFGAATMAKLGKIDRKIDALAAKLDIMDSKLDELSMQVDRLGWNVEIGFASTLRSLSLLQQSVEQEINAQLTAAAQGAWSAQFLAPESSQRMTRLEHARALVGVATERLLEDAAARFRFIDMLVDNSADGAKPYLLLSQDSVREFFGVLRRAIVAVQLNGAIMAECGDVYAAATVQRDQARRLRTMLATIGTQFLGSGKLHIYQALMDSVYAECMPLARLEAWMGRFDPARGGLVALIAMLRNENMLGSGADEKDMYEIARVKDAIAFCGRWFDWLDGCWEDVGRLEGNAIELELAARRGIGWQQYREMFAFDDIPDDVSLVFLLPQEELLST